MPNNRQNRSIGRPLVSRLHADVSCGYYFHIIIWIWDWPKESHVVVEHLFLSCLFVIMLLFLLLIQNSWLLSALGLHGRNICTDFNFLTYKTFLLPLLSLIPCVCLVQRMDLGECLKVHDLALRADYEIASKHQEYFFELDVSVWCEQDAVDRVVLAHHELFRYVVGHFVVLLKHIDHGALWWACGKIQCRKKTVNEELCLFVCLFHMSTGYQKKTPATSSPRSVISSQSRLQFELATTS